MHTVSVLFNLYQQPPGGVIYSVEGTKQAAVRLNLPDVAQSCDACLESARAYLDRNGQWERTKNTSKARGEGEARTLDPTLDRSVAGIYNHVENLVRSFSKDHELAVAAREFSRLAFPNGAEGITSLPYAEELVAVKNLIQRSDDPDDLAALVDKLSLKPMVENLRELAVKFETALRRVFPGETTWDQLKVAAADCHERYVQLVALIAGKYNLQTPEHIAARVALLGPIMEQDARIAESRKLRRPVPDVDPNTGELLVTPTEPTTPAEPVDPG
ncbi:MAG: DUF6261 family protein [Polyangiaceae bacterium]|jgi:hypothetical protein|nr:DUF6261 family protein [Polyangiaceae bacterium]